MSHDSLVMMLESDEAVAPAAFHAALIETVREYGATFNQRVLLKAAFNRALGVKGY